MINQHFGFFFCLLVTLAVSGYLSVLSAYTHWLAMASPYTAFMINTLVFLANWQSWCVSSLQLVESIAQVVCHHSGLTQLNDDLIYCYSQLLWFRSWFAVVYVAYTITKHVDLPPVTVWFAINLHWTESGEMCWDGCWLNWMLLQVVWNVRDAVAQWEWRCVNGLLARCLWTRQERCGQ